LHPLAPSPPEVWDDATQGPIRELRWEPPRPAREGGQDSPGPPILDNDSGEDFLYMHRRMIGAVNERLAEVGGPSVCVQRLWEPRPPSAVATQPWWQANFGKPLFVLLAAVRQPVA